MSHVVSCNLRVDANGLDDFKAACKEIGLEFKQNQKTWKWYGSWVGGAGSAAAAEMGIDPKDCGTCDHAAGVPGDSKAYELGLMPTKDGNWAIAFDLWGTQGKKLQAIIGERGEKLKQAYIIHRTMRQVKKSKEWGMKTVKKDGKVRIVLTKKGS